MRKLRLALITICFLACPSLYGQTTAKKKAPTVQGLQQQVIDLQTKLMECQNTAKANEPSPMKDALEAFQTFNSTVDTGLNQAAYKAAVVPLKVKVDKLPDNEQTAPMKKTLDMFVDAGNLWNISITRNENMQHLAVPVGYVQVYIDKYKEAWIKLDTAERERNPDIGGCNSGHKVVWASCIKALGSVLIDKGQENIKSFTTVSKP